MMAQAEACGYPLKAGPVAAGFSLRFFTHPAGRGVNAPAGCVVWLRAVLVVLALLLTQGSRAQALPERSKVVQAGVGLLPGIGVHTGYVSTRSFYTVESILYMDASPQFFGGEANLQVSLGLGGAIRPLGLLRTIGNTAYRGYDLYIGLRFGPGLFFASEESRALKNQRFNLFLEPFFRLTSELGTRQTFFAEFGFQRPLLRAGFWFRL